MAAKISIQKGDITKLKVDAIVNAANTSLLGGGGVDGAIHRAGGPQILEACIQIRNKQGGCAVGEAVITTGGRLPAKFVIHTVGPVWNGGNKNEPALLESAYRYSLQLAVQHGIKTIAFPNISTGIYHFPKQAAGAIAIAAVKKSISENAAIEEVLFVCFDEENYGIYNMLLNDQS
ncbi:MAG: O-acetyl-ADP-ribose deacetylase [Chitinophagaceae bacterium]